MNEWMNTAIAVAVAVIGLATLSVILSKQANTAGVITAGATGLGSVIKAAVSPIGAGGLSTGLVSLDGGNIGYNPGQLFH